MLGFITKLPLKDTCKYITTVKTDLLSARTDLKSLKGIVSSLYSQGDVKKVPLVIFFMKVVNK